MLVGVINVHITTALVSLVPVGIVRVLVGSGVVRDVTSSVVGTRLVMDITSLVGTSGVLDHTELGGSNSQKGTGQLESTKITDGKLIT